jgi:hypothetical protein
MTQELVPWIKQHLSTSDSEQIWLIGFSKSGIGGRDLILKHPDLFTWPQANYRLTTAFVDVRKEPFLINNRIWIGGYSLYSTDDPDYNNLLTSEAIVHSYVTQQYPAHSWGQWLGSGSYGGAVSGQYQSALIRLRAADRRSGGGPQQ